MTTLQQYLGAAAQDSAYVESCAAAAEALVSKLIGSRAVPDEARAAAVLETGANLYRRRVNNTDLNQYTNGLPQPVAQRPALDPTLPARNILAMYLGPGIA